MIVDVLMITYNRSEYTRRSLKALCESADGIARVWVWHNGDDEKTLSVVRGFVEAGYIYKFYHCKENKKLREPTNWFWSNAEGDYLGKVDDDCVVPVNWLQTLVSAHGSNPRFGIIGCWHFLEEDFNYEIAKKKIVKFSGGHQLLRNCWVGGSGYLMKRECINVNGLLGGKEGFTQYCFRLALHGWINGWYFPFLYQDHMDDPRSAYTRFNDVDFSENKPLTTFSTNNIDQYLELLKKDALNVQKASINPILYTRPFLVIKRILHFHQMVGYISRIVERRRRA